MSIGVVYLSRGIDGGLDAAHKFLESYNTHKAGVKHTLYVLLKGWDNEGEYARAQKMFTDIGATLIDLPDDGYDWGAYFRCIKHIERTHVCFLNTHSRIMADNWLNYLYDACTAPEIGLVGCTGSYGTIARAAQVIKPSLFISHNSGWIKGLFKCVKSFIAYILYYPIDRKFPRFPNPHVRSNAFITRTDLFHKYARTHNIPVTKRQTFALESGHNGYTRFIENENLQARLVNRNGDVFAPAQWLESQTFRVPNGQKCLVSDNQTRYYEGLSLRQRNLSEISAWGKVLTENKL